MRIEVIFPEREGPMGTDLTGSGRLGRRKLAQKSVECRGR